MNKRAVRHTGNRKSRRGPAALPALHIASSSDGFQTEESLALLSHPCSLACFVSIELDLIQLNRTAINFFGQESSRLEQCLSAESLSMVRDHAVGAVMRTGCWGGELELLDHSGAIRPASVVIERQNFADGSAMLLLAVPETDPTQFSSIARFQRLFEHHPHPVWVYDLETLRFLLVNEAAIQNYGYSREEFQRMTIKDIRPAFEVPRLLENLAKPASEGSERSGFWVHQRKNGERITVDVSSHSIVIGGRKARFVFAHDVTEHQMIERALYESKEMQQLVINHIPQEIFWKNLRSVYKGCNEKFAIAAGLSSDSEIVGKVDYQLPWSADADQIVAEDQAIIRTGRPLINHVAHMLFGDGSWHWFLINKMPLHDQRGNTIGVLGTMEDITSRKRADLTLQLQGRAIEASINAIVIAINLDGTEQVEYANPAFTQLTGFSQEEVLGVSFGTLLGHGISAEDQLVLRAAMSSHHESSVTLQCMRKDASRYWCQLLVAPVKNVEGMITHHVCVMNDMTATMSYQAQLEHQASHDALTKLPNRNLFLDRLHQAIGYAQRFQHRIWVMCIDLDNFNLVNDTLGHRVGDELLCVIANRLKHCLRESDTVARLGGDEFWLLLDYSHAQLSAGLLQKMLDAVAAPVHLANQELTVTCSIGVSLYSEEGDEPDALMRQADIAMYRAKEAGKNCAQFFEPAMNARIAERTAIEHELRTALRRGEFTLHYQPKLGLRTGEIVGMEALIRWSHPELGLVSPLRFIGVAEETGLIVPIGKWALRTACAQNKAWQDLGLPCVPVAVNLSARQFHDKELLHLVVEALQDSGLNARDLELEVTESHMMANVDAAVATLTQLHELGIGLAIDDFGTGYSSLAYLKLFPLSCLKIDKSFIQNMLDDPSGAAIVRSIIGLGHSLRFQVIAEGVETEAQLAYLKRNDCDEMQGFLFSPPVCADEFEKLWVNHLQAPPGENERRHAEGTVLIVSPDESLVSSLKAAFADDAYTLLFASNVKTAYEQISLHEIQIIVADLNLDGMDAGHFFEKVKRIHPRIARIILSRECDPAALIDAINKAEVFRIYSPAWSEKQLRDDVREALRIFRANFGEK